MLIFPCYRHGITTLQEFLFHFVENGLEKNSGVEEQVVDEGSHYFGTVFKMDKAGEHKSC